uniref:Uncharacterized protein n=1 Tax=Cucumis melo TaxID=3656 RepID=A0A9I9ECG8_CUCME
WCSLSFASRCRLFCLSVVSSLLVFIVAHCSWLRVLFVVARKPPPRVLFVTHDLSTVIHDL